MSFSRCASPAAVSAGTVLRFTSTPLSRTCPLATRTFSYSSASRFSSRRKLMTESSFRPHTYDFPPPPPRDPEVPGAAVPAVNESAKDTVTSQEAASAGLPTLQSTDRKSPPTAQKVNTEAPKGTEKPKRKFRARKAAMTLTPTAVEHLKELLELPEPKLIRVGVKNRGCSGLAYHLEYVEKAGTFDEVLEQDGVKVLIDSKALFSIIGSEMDWMEDKLSQRFVFKNPNIKEECGCGESFSVG